MGRVEVGLEGVGGMSLAADGVVGVVVLDFDGLAGGASWMVAVCLLEGERRPFAGKTAAGMAAQRKEQRGAAAGWCATEQMGQRLQS